MESFARIIGNAGNEEIIAAFEQALENNEFHMYLQPEHCIQNEDKVLRAEALARWIGVDGTIILPTVFIPPLERSGVAYKLDRFIMTELCKFISAHLNEPWIKNFKFSVNASKEDLKRNDFLDFYIDIKEDYDIPDNLVEIEFTESTFYGDYGKFRKILQKLKNYGYTCSMDDFGTGTSSLTMLKELPVSVLKMDKNFFDDHNRDNSAKNNAIIASIVAMGRGLGLTIVAEGVEDIEQLEFLRKLGCDHVQGFVYTEALDIGNFIQYVTNFRPRKKEIGKSVERILLRDKQKISNDALQKRYMDTLRYVNAVIIEVFLDSDEYCIITGGKVAEFLDNVEGQFTTVFDTYVQKNVHPDYRELVRKKCQLKNIMTYLYRGDKEIKLEYLAKSFDPITKKIDGPYQWNEVTINFEEFENSPKALVYMANIQERKLKENDMINVQKRLEYVISSIPGVIYEIDYVNDKVKIIKGTDDGTVFKNGSFKSNFIDYIRYFVHEDDQASLMNILSASNVKALEKGKNISFTIEYREMNGEEENRKRINCLGTIKDDGNKAYVVVQDVPSNIDQQYVDIKTKFIQNALPMYDMIFEINMKNNHCDIIKSSVEIREATSECITYDEFYEAIKELDIIHPDDEDCFFTELDPKNLKKVFKLGEKINFDYRFFNYDTDRYEWREAYTANNTEYGVCMLFFVDINDRKQRDEAQQNALIDPSTNVFTAEGFIERISEYLKYKGANSVHSLICISLDNFDFIKYKGEQFVEMTMQSFVQRIRKQFDDQDIIGRIGSSEIAILMRDTTDEDALAHIQSVANAMKQEAIGEINCTFSAGVAAYPTHSVDEKELINFAHVALVKGQKRGNSNCYIYDSVFGQGENVVLLEKKGPLSQQDILYNIFNILYSARKLNEAIPLILSYIGSKYDASSVYLLEFDNNLESLHVGYEWNEDGRRSIIKKIKTIRSEDIGINQRYINYFKKTGASVTCNNIKLADEGIQNFLKPLEVKAFIQSPIIANDELRGFMFIADCRDTRVWTNDEIVITGKITRRMSVFIDRTRLVVENKKQHSIIDSVLNNNQTMNYVIDPSGFELLYISESLKKIMPFAQTGMKCHKAFMGIDTPCENCPIRDFYDQVEIVKLKQEFIWPVTNNYVEATVDEIEWYDDRKACIVSYYDLSKYK